MDTVVLVGKKELDIFINPQRQRLLRAMTLAGQPMTPKQLSGELGISPSAVQHHLGKLVELGVVAESRTERIHGITAHYYAALPVSVRVGCGVRDEHEGQRMALVQNGINAVLTGFANYLAQQEATSGQKETAELEPASSHPAQANSAKPELSERTGDAGSVTPGASEGVAIPPAETPADVLWGIVRLPDAEARELMSLVRGFLQAHEGSGHPGEPWEYALIAYPAGGRNHA